MANNDPTLYGGESPPLKSTNDDHDGEGHICAPDEEYDLRLKGGEIAFLLRAAAMVRESLLTITAFQHQQNPTEDPPVEIIHDIFYGSTCVPKLDAFREARVSEEQARHLAGGPAHEGLMN